MMEIYLTTPVTTQVSDEDFIFLSGIPFVLSDWGYLRCRILPYRGKYLHQLVAERMGLILKEGETIDHKDTDIYNNQRDNLRPANKQQQQANRLLMCRNKTGRKGVSEHRETGKHIAQIMIDGRNRTLWIGTLDKCAEMYIQVAKERDGEFFNPGF